MAEYFTRMAAPADIPGILTTGKVLGYPVPEDSVNNPAKILSHENHIIFVAENESGEIIGWIHAFVALRIASESFLESGGLAVLESWRRKGVGRALTKEVIQWAQKYGYKKIRVRMNKQRKETGDFYTGIGFRHIKTQNVYQYDI